MPTAGPQPSAGWQRGDGLPRFTCGSGVKDLDFAMETWTRPTANCAVLGQDSVASGREGSRGVELYWLRTGEAPRIGEAPRAEGGPWPNAKAGMLTSEHEGARGVKALGVA